MLAKVPSPGRVKTRLVPPLTDAQASALARAFIRDLATRLIESEVRLRAKATVFYTPATGGNEMAVLVHGLRMASQFGLDLGQRLRTAVHDLQRDGFDRIVVIGSDSPTLPVRLIERAFDVLDAGADLAISAAEDGGYVLLGLNGVHANVFEGIPWSTERVYERTLERARMAGLTAAELDPWYDVDDGTSLDRLCRELRGDDPIGDEAVHTREALRSFART